MSAHPDFQLALARGRSEELLAAAAARRRVRQARAAAVPAAVASGTAERGRVVRQDGPAVLIRPVRGTGAPLVARGFARLSERYRQLRFLGRKTTLTEADLRYFTNVDHHDHEALGALDHVPAAELRGQPDPPRIGHR